MEEILDKKIRGGLMGIKNGTKEPIEVFQLIKRMQSINLGLYEMFLKQYMVLGKEKQVA